MNRRRFLLAPLVALVPTAKPEWTMSVELAEHSDTEFWVRWFLALDAQQRALARAIFDI